MAAENPEVESILKNIDPNELADLACKLANIPSPTGQETELADFILSWYRSHGLKAIRQEVDPGRPNAVGILKGSGGGLSLMFNGHMDTTFTGTDEDLLVVPKVAQLEELTAIVRNGKVIGPGVSNMKGGLASFMVAAKALSESGIKLKGDVILAAVVGEISRSPVDSYQGKEYRGEGVGTRHLLSHGIQSDYAICADGSDMNLVWAQLGVVQMKITVYGRGGNAWGTDRKTHPSTEMNAVVKMMKFIEALETWGTTWEAENVYQSSTGPLLPRVIIGAINGGAPFRPYYFPAVCNLYVDVRIPPNIQPIDVQNDVETMLSSLEVGYDLEVYRSMRGYEASGAEPLIQAIDEAYQHLFGRTPDPETPSRSSIWTDTNIYNEIGIPTVKIGPRGNTILPRLEEIEIEQMVQAAKLYALVSLDICQRSRPTILAK